MLIELAVGDAYGAGFEYAPAGLVHRTNTLSGYVRRKTDQISAVGYYTDDTQMSLAIAEAIVSGEAWTPENLAKRFVEVFHRNRRTGYASRFYEFLCNTHSGYAFLQNIRPGSDKSGAAMRAAPIGIYPTIQIVMERATLQAKLTHDTSDGIAAACAAALMSHYFLYNYGKKSDLGAFLDAHIPGYDWSEPWVGKVGSKGWMSVHAAVTAVMTGDHMSDILHQCVAFTGDVDTVATVALAAASCSPEVVQDIPAVLIDHLENNGFGCDYIRELDRQLMALVRVEK